MEVALRDLDDLAGNARRVTAAVDQAVAEGLLAAQFERRGYDPETAPLYAQMLVGMVAYTGQWWLETHKPSKEVLAARLVNLSWFGLAAMEKKPVLRGGADV